MEIPLPLVERGVEKRKAKVWPPPRPSGMSAMTAPAVLLGPIDDAGANGIESDIANDGEQLGLFFDQMPVEPALEQVSVTLVSLVEPLGVASARATACPGRRSARECR